MTTLRRDTYLGVTFAFVSHARWFTGLWVDQLDIRNVDERFLINNSSTAVRRWIRLLMAFDHPYAFNFDFAPCWSNLKHASTSSFVAPGDYHNVLVLAYFRTLCSCHLLITSGF